MEKKNRLDFVIKLEQHKPAEKFSFSKQLNRNKLEDIFRGRNSFSGTSKFLFQKFLFRKLEKYPLFSPVTKQEKSG
jgi:hypothetical protein